MINPLNWDSKLFKRKIGKLELFDSVYPDIITSDFELIYVTQTLPFNVHINHFEEKYCGKKILFSKAIQERDVFDTNNVTSYSNKNSSNLNRLYQLGFQSGKYSRFKEDTNFTDSEFKALYKSWIDNSISKEIADDLLIYSIDDKIYGLITYKINKGVAKIGLLAVAPEARGKGIGSNLILKVEEKLFPQIKELEVETQEENIQACLFYQKNAFVSKKEILIKHFWRNDTL